MKKLILLFIAATSIQALALPNINSSGSDSIINLVGNGKWVRLICPNKEITKMLLSDLINDVSEDPAAQLYNIQINASAYLITVKGGGNTVNATVPLASGCILITQ